jgi:4-amino-4-deoxy-L-arabinose transferase-like glycosyltransferase
VRRPKIPLHLVALALITAGAAVLRLVDLGSVRLDPFYDAAVRSMGLSWHNFFFGAYEPGGSVSIDKPPVDLWLQVVSVKLLGYGSTSLKLPEALAGSASVPLLYAAMRRPFGVTAGLVAALSLAVLPIEVVTARSDTMDAVMMMLLVLALLLLVLACESGRTLWLLAAAATLGVAFDVKLLESFVALPGLLLIAWLGLPHRAPAGEPASPAGQSLPSRDVGMGRLTRLALAAVVYVVVALSWLGATLLFPAHSRPYAIGSSNGSAWNAAFVFNGVDRITGKTVEPGQTSEPAQSRSPVSMAQARDAPTRSKPAPATITPPSPTRLLARTGELPGTWLGWEALMALLLGLPAVVAFARHGSERVPRAAALGLYAWLLTGVVFFSAMARLHPRYVEGFTPAVAAMLGISVAWLAGTHRRVRHLVVIPVALLAIPLTVSVKAVQDSASDAGDVGALNSSEQQALSRYLLAHQGSARYELAAGAATSVASLIVQDVRPVLMLTTYEGRPFTSVTQLEHLIARGEVRYALLDSVCTPHAVNTSAGCAPAARWIRAHGTDVSHQAGLRTGGILWRLPGAIA